MYFSHSGCCALTSGIWLSTTTSIHVCPPSGQLYSSSDSRTLYIPHVKTKTFGHRSLFFQCCPFCLEFSASVMKWNTLSQQLHLKPLWKPTSLKPATCKLLNLFFNYFSWLMWCVCACMCLRVVVVCVCVCVFIMQVLLYSLWFPGIACTVVVTIILLFFTLGVTTWM